MTGYVDIVVLAVVAAGLLAVLWRILGTRSGHEPQPGPNPFSNTNAPVKNSVVSPLERALNAKPVKATVLEGAPDDLILSVNQGLKQIQDYDPEFSERGFVSGARAAFEIIVKAYARGQLDALKPLLDDKLYQQFAEDAKVRAGKAYQMETVIHRLKSVDITAARMRGFEAEVAIDFISEQTTCVEDAHGTLVAGSKEALDEVHDSWIFRRDVRAADPNWLLVETRDKA